MTRQVPVRISLGLFAATAVVLATMSMGVASAAATNTGVVAGDTFLQTVCFNSATPAVPDFTTSGTVLARGALPTPTSEGSPCNGDPGYEIGPATTYNLETQYAASYRGSYSVDVYSQFKYSLATSSSATYTVNMTLMNWVAESYSTYGCWNDDNASGEVSYMVNTSLLSSSGKVLAGPVNYDYPNGPLRSCTNGNDGYPSYQTGGVYYTTGPYQVGIELAGLSLTKGDTYKVQVVLVCVMTGSAWGPNMSTDSETDSLTTCGTQSGDGQVWFNSVTVFV